MLPSAETPPRRAKNEKAGFFAMLKKMIGADLTTISMPIFLHEPMSFLQRMAENCQYYDLLQQAGSTDDRIRQLTLTAAFAASAYSTNHRLKKPFNPYLGETYQYEEGNIRFFAEQVSHHPPIGACVLEGPNFIFWSDMSVKTKYCGNSLDVTPIGEWHVRFKNNGNHIVWSGAKTVINNIIIGSLWIDCFGQLGLKSLTHGETAELAMKEAGSFGKDRWRCTGKVMSTDYKIQESFSGKWNSNIKSKSGETLWTHSLGTRVTGDKYGRTDLIFKLTANPVELLAKLPTTDSRFRKDLLALQAGDSDLAAAEKRALEIREADLRVSRKEQGIDYQPRWFVQSQTPDSTSAMWLYMGGYWETYGSEELMQVLGPTPSFLSF